MKYLNNIYSGFLLILAISLVTTSCTKEKDREFNQERLFSPGRIKVTTEEKRAILTWSPSLFSQGKALQYTVELSKDSSFQTIDYTVVSDTTGVTITDDVLKPRQKYVVRVKANAFNNTPESNWLLSSKFSITGEQWFKPLQSADIIDNGVLVKWTLNPDFKKITLSQGGQSTDITLTADDLAAGQKIITGLKANTPYSVELFDATKSKGYLSFTTNRPLEGNIVDLRGIEGRPSILADTLPVVPTGSTIILKKGQTYNITSSIVLDKSIMVVSGDDLAVPTQAILYITTGSGFNVTANSNIEYLKFKNVTVRSDSYSSRYLFNISNACTIGTVSFESCRAEIFRGLFRAQGTASITVTNYFINECVLDSLKEYAVLSADGSGSKVENIKITNSTIYKAEKLIVARNNATSVLLENCTINEAPLGGNFLIDYSTFNVAQGITIKNSIFGIGKTKAGDTNVKGINVGSGTGVAVSGSYKTSDYTIALNASPIPDLLPYTGASTDLWQEPFNGNFKIKDASFAGKSTAGDPRWR